MLELVAVGAPLEVGLLEPGELAALEALERRELVQRRTDGRRRFVDVAHPLHGEAVRARLTPTRAEAIHTRLADAVEARGARRGGDLLRIAVWRLEAGATGDAALFARAADQALAALDPVLAERLARAAVQAGGGFGARLALGRALAAAGRGARGRARCSPTWRRRPATTASERPSPWLGRATCSGPWTAPTTRTPCCGTPSSSCADDATAPRADGAAGAADRRAGPPAGGPGRRASRCWTTARSHERARTTVALGAVEALFSSGRTDEAVALAEASLPVARRRRDELPHAEPVLLGMRAMALRLAGRLVEATTFSESAYALLLPRRSAPATAVEANSLGLIWLARGRVRTALRFCRESAALLRDGDGVGMLAFALAGVGQAAAQAGEPDAARGALAEMERTPLGHKGFAVELELARAWSAAASGELSRARALARERGRARTVARPGRLRRPRAARALPAGRPGGRRARARPARRAASTGRSPRPRPRTPRRSSPATAPPCSRSPSASPPQTRCSWPPRRRTPRPPRTATPAGRRAPAPPPRAPPSG